MQIALRLFIYLIAVATLAPTALLGESLFRRWYGGRKNKRGENYPPGNFLTRHVVASSIHGLRDAP